MRILYVVNQMARGGAETQIFNLATSLVRRGHAIGIVSMMPFLDFEASLRTAGVKTFSLGIRGRTDGFTALPRYLGVVRSFRPDVVHAHLYVANIFCRVARALMLDRFGSPRVLVCTSHVRIEDREHRYRVYGLTAPLANAWTSVSREGIAIHEARGAVARGSGRWMPNGIDVSRFTPAAESRHGARAELGLGDGFVWLAAGAFRDETKDYGTMLAAFRALPVGSTLIIAGEGRLLEEKRALAKQLGMSDRVRFLGLRLDIARLLAAADAFVMSSQTEAMPIVLLEAGAMGLPCVTTNVGEASAIVLHEKTGFVVPPRDPQRLTEGLARMEQRDARARAEFGDAARAHVTGQFELERVVDRWLDLFHELRDGKPDP